MEITKEHYEKQQKMDMTFAQTLADFITSAMIMKSLGIDSSIADSEKEIVDLIYAVLKPYRKISESVDELIKKWLDSFNNNLSMARVGMLNEKALKNADVLDKLGKLNNLTDEQKKVIFELGLISEKECKDEEKME